MSVNIYKNYDDLVTENKRLLVALENATKTAHNAPELNMSNFNEEDVTELNQAMIDVYHILHEATDKVN